MLHWLCDCLGLLCDFPLESQLLAAAIYLLLQGSAGNNGIDSIGYICRDYTPFGFQASGF